MRSLSTRMLVAAIGTLLASFVAFVMVFALTGPKIMAVFHGFQSLQLEDAVAAFTHGGAPEAAAYLDRLSNRLGTAYYLTDARGRDVLSGEDRSALLGTVGINHPRHVGDRMVLTEVSADGRYHLVIVAPQPFRVIDFLPYYFLITGAVALFWWLLAVGIASPIRQLTATVDRFGRGDLESRARSARRDEIGNLARVFNDMANRIQTMLTAERQLLQDISHELRSPLARLSLGLELLPTTPDREHAIRRICIDVDRLSTLVASLLDVTRSDGDPASRKTAAVDVGAIVREAVESSALESEARGCRVRLEGDTTGILLGDPELMRRAVDNVIQNAIRHAPANTTVEVSIVEQHTSLLISIRDYGEGVPEALLPRLTAPFFRVDAARDANTGGVGLGLAIAKRALDIHHGRLVAENAHPGLRMILTIPRSEFTRDDHRP